MTNPALRIVKSANPLEIVKTTDPAQLLEFVRDEHPHIVGAYWFTF